MFSKNLLDILYRVSFPNYREDDSYSSDEKEMFFLAYFSRYGHRGIPTKLFDFIPIKLKRLIASFQRRNLDIFRPDEKCKILNDIIRGDFSSIDDFSFLDSIGSKAKYSIYCLCGFCIDSPPDINIVDKRILNGIADEISLLRGGTFCMTPFVSALFFELYCDVVPSSDRKYFTYKVKIEFEEELTYLVNKHDEIIYVRYLGAPKKIIFNASSAQYEYLYQ